MKHLSLKIFGKVQKVFFRFSIKEIAEVFGLTGWVKNELDGSVRVEAEGSTKNLQKLLEWCQKGPENSKVEDIEYKWSDNLKKYQPFEIIY